ncbi:MAG: LPS export ABC transporter periplasmic protein LptC [Methylotenera sp.]|nr:LPS export ABC transporter periplasmic protein LptC [Oligoflexia bacterium]
MTETGQSQNTPLLKRLRPFLIVAVSCFIIFEIVALTPSNLEQSSTSETSLTEESLLPHVPGDTTLAAGIPVKKVPDYSIDGFNYVSTHAGQKQWKLVAKRAFLYNKEKIVHSRTVTAYLYDAQDKITLVEGREAKYFMDGRDLEIYGDVKTTFPDGFTTQSEYMKYSPTHRQITVPLNYTVHGQGEQLGFDSHGLDFSMDRSRIILPEAVRVTLTKSQPKVDSPSVDGATTSPGVPEKTTVDSDRCEIDRLQQIAYFTMYPSRPLKKRFVQIRQPGLYSRSRRSEMHYGDFAKLLNYMTAYEDVLIQELDKPSAPRKTALGASVEKSRSEVYRYGTGGRADFDTQRNVIILKEFPQVYQDNDTVTGDVIIVHRDTDIVEVEHSNAFSAGEPQSK